MKHLALACMGIALLAGTGCAASTRSARQRLVGRPAADFSLSALGGESVRLSDFRGSPVLLAFWAYG